MAQLISFGSVAISVCRTFAALIACTLKSIIFIVPN